MKIKGLILVLGLMVSINCHSGFWTGVLVASAYNSSRDSSSSSCSDSCGDSYDVKKDVIPKDVVPIETKPELELALEKITEIGYPVVERFIKKHKLYFVCNGEYPYCHGMGMSPNVEKVNDRFGFDITAVSLDGKELEGFSGFIKRFKTWATRALLVVDKSTLQIVSVSYGSKSEGQIVNWFAGVLFEWNKNNKEF